MSFHFSRLAVLAAIAGLTACSGGTQAAPPANAGGVQISTLSTGEHLVRLGSHTIRYGGPQRTANAHRGWISPDAKKGHVLYASSYNGEFINLYKEGGNGQQPIGQLTSDLVSPQGLFLDKKHHLWVTNTNAFTVLAFKRGATSPYVTLNDPGYYPISVVVDRHGTVYAANAQGQSGQPGNVTVWANGSTSPTATLTYSNFLVVTNIGIDSNSNVYVSYVPTSGPPAVVVFAAGSSTGTPLNVPDAGLSDIAFDSSNNLLMETLQNVLGVWAPPYTSGPARTISAFGNEPTINKRNTEVWVAYANPSNPMVEGYNYTSGALVDTITAGFSAAGFPYGIAVDPREHP